jgi:hypothetical protein
VGPHLLAHLLVGAERLGYTIYGPYKMYGGPNAAESIFRRSGNRFADKIKAARL